MVPPPARRPGRGELPRAARRRARPASRAHPRRRRRAGAVSPGEERFRVYLIGNAPDQASEWRPRCVPCRTVGRAAREVWDREVEGFWSWALRAVDPDGTERQLSRAEGDRWAWFLERWRE